MEVELVLIQKLDGSLMFSKSLWSFLFLVAFSVGPSVGPSVREHESKSAFPPLPICPQLVAVYPALLSLCFIVADTRTRDSTPCRVGR